MTKFELTRTAGRWRQRSRTYVALAILFVTAWPTNAKDLTLPDHKLTPGAIRHDLSKREICAYASCGSTPTGMENRGQGRASMVMTPVAGLHQCLCAVGRADRLAGSCMKLFFFGLHNGQVRLDSPAPAMFSHTTV